MTPGTLLIAALLVLPCVGCKIEPHTGMPVWDDQSTSDSPISTVPPHAPNPVTSDYPKLPPLDALDPTTGKARPLSSWFEDEAHQVEAKVAQAMEHREAR